MHLSVKFGWCVYSVHMYDVYLIFFHCLFVQSFLTLSPYLCSCSGVQFYALDIQLKYTTTHKYRMEFFSLSLEFFCLFLMLCHAML